MKKILDFFGQLKKISQNDVWNFLSNCWFWVFVIVGTLQDYNFKRRIIEKHTQNTCENFFKNSFFFLFFSAL